MILQTHDIYKGVKQKGELYNTIHQEKVFKIQ